VEVPVGCVTVQYRTSVGVPYGTVVPVRRCGVGRSFAVGRGTEIESLIHPWMARMGCTGMSRFLFLFLCLFSLSLSISPSPRLGTACASLVMERSWDGVDGSHTPTVHTTVPGIVGTRTGTSTG